MTFENFSSPVAKGDRQNPSMALSQISDDFNAKLLTIRTSRNETNVLERLGFPSPKFDFTNNEHSAAGALGRGTDSTRSQTRQPGEQPGEQRSSGRTSNQNPWSHPRDGQPVPQRPTEQSKNPLERAAKQPETKTQDAEKSQSNEKHKDHSQEGNKEKPRTSDGKHHIEEKPGDKKHGEDVTVKHGDTLWSIARRSMNESHPDHKPSHKEILKMIYEIAKENGVKNIDLIHPGQHLKLPKHR